MLMTIELSLMAAVLLRSMMLLRTVEARRIPVTIACAASRHSRLHERDAA